MDRIADSLLYRSKLILANLKGTRRTVSAPAPIKVAMALGMIRAIVRSPRTSASWRRLVPAFGQDSLGADHRKVTDLAEMTNRDDLNGHNYDTKARNATNT